MVNGGMATSVASKGRLRNEFLLHAQP